MRPAILAWTAALGVAAAASMASGALAAERLLVQDTNMLVVVDRETACGDPVPITVRSADAGLFQDGSTRLQHVVDGVRAILGFECARTPRLEITGQAGSRDTGEVLFAGIAGDETGWLVQRQERADRAPAPSAGTGAGPLTMGSLAATTAAAQPIGGVATGMSLEAAIAGAAAQFDGEPRYLEDRHLLVAAEGGCDFRFDDGDAPEPGWRCLEAAFTEAEPRRVYAVGLSQAVDKDQREQIVASLTERFGPPEQVIHGQQDGHPYTFLSWGEVVAEDRGGRLDEIDAPLRRLEALALARDGLTVLTLWQQDPVALRGEEPEHRVRL